MIKQLTCSDPRFRSINFQPGLNVILAERTQESTKEDTCNGVGKSTFIGIVDFLLGASTGSKQLTSSDELKGWIFELKFDIRGQNLVVNRGIDSPKKLSIVGLDDDKSKQRTIGLNEWTDYLGQMFFNIDPDEVDSPSFRSLIPYFIRREPGAFLDPFETFAKMPIFKRQLNNSYLLGLDWKIPVAFETLDKREDILKHLKREAAAGTLIGAEGKLGDLEIEKVRLESHLVEQHKQLDSFQIHPQYREIEIRANQLTMQIHELSDANYQDRLIIDLYNKSLADEREASRENIALLYKEANFIFSQQITKRLEEVEQFHKEVARNRKSYLEVELARLRRQISDRETVIEELSLERANLLNILKTHNALDEHTALQQRYSLLTAQLVLTAT